MAIYHISGYKRSDGNSGGVEKFADYLSKAIGCKIVTPDERLSLQKGDTIIGDGYHVEGFDTRYLKIISVVHGTWAEFAKRHDKVTDFKGEIERQHKVWSDSSIHKVALSQASAMQLFKHHGVLSDTVIKNGIDTSLFVPKEHELHQKPVIIHVAKEEDYNKNGRGLLYKVKDILEDQFEFKYLSAKIGEEQDKFAEGDMFLHCSIYEGNSYACLEAMSCDLPCVVSNVGLFETEFTPATTFNPIINTPEEIAHTIRSVWKFRILSNTRQWITQNASFELFKTNWINYLKTI